MASTHQVNSDAILEGMEVANVEACKKGALIVMVCCSMVVFTKAAIVVYTATTAPRQQELGEFKMQLIYMLKDGSNILENDVYLKRIQGAATFVCLLDDCSSLACRLLAGWAQLGHGQRCTDSHVTCILYLCQQTLKPSWRVWLTTTSTASACISQRMRPAQPPASVRVARVLSITLTR